MYHREGDALETYWDSWRLRIQIPWQVHSRRDAAKIVMLKVFGIEGHVKAVVENDSQSQCKRADFMRILRLHQGSERL